MSTAAVLLAVAMLIAADPTPVRRRAGLSKPLDRPPRSAPGADVDLLAVAFSFEVLAACLSSGMAVSRAAAAAASSAPPELAGVLNRAADLLALGADPARAWSNPVVHVSNQTASLLRLARRSAASGTALAHGVAELATHSRHEAADAASAAAERASVLIAGPLGLCYLPAFVCLGIVPVVAGMAGDVLRSGVL